MFSSILKEGKTISSSLTSVIYCLDRFLQGLFNTNLAARVESFPVDG